MSENDLGTRGKFGSGRVRRSRSRGKILAATWGVVLVVGPSFFGATASTRPLRDVTTKEATTKPGVAPQAAGRGAANAALHGLVSVQASGVGIRPVQQAAAEFLATLPPRHAARSPLPTTAAEWLDRLDASSDARGGSARAGLNTAQRAMAVGLIAASLHAEGLSSAEGIIKVSDALGPLDSAAPLNHFTLLGQPTPDQPWGWELAGPQFVIHYFVVGDQVTMTPTCLTPEPADHLAAVHATPTR